MYTRENREPFYISNNLDQLLGAKESLKIYRDLLNLKDTECLS